MNPLTLVRRTQNINAKEAELGISDQASWHANYKDSAYVYAGGLPFDLTEGDLLAVFAQYGEIVDVNLVREKSTGKSKGFAFVAYEDQRSTILAVDNLNGAQLAGRTIRVDHVSNYKKKEEEDEETERLKREERGVCRAFQKGECKYGDSCKFSHDEQRAADTGWGQEEDRKAKSAYNKFDKSSANDKKSYPPPTHDGRSFGGKKITETIPKRNIDRSGYQDDDRTEKRSSKYEPELKRSRDHRGEEMITTSRHDKEFRDIRDDRDRDRSRDRDRGREEEKKRKDRERDRERQQHRREREDDGHYRDRHDEDYRRSHK